MKVDLVVANLKEVVTVAGPPGPRTGKHLRELGVIQDGAVAVSGGRIVAVGARRDVTAEYQPAETVDGRGGVALPGFVDAHTHLVYAGSRETEFERRLRGESYQDIARAGGGIRATVRRVREATLHDLVREAIPRLDRMLAHGTTAAEAKTGYGLSLEDERKSLDAIHALRRVHPVDLVPTFLGAHEVPDEYRGNREGYIRLVCEEMIPDLAAQAIFCDVFCEEGVFTPAESRRILLAARSAGMALKVHADELGPSGGADLAAELHACSADHLVAITPAAIRRLRSAGVIAVLLPGTSFFLRLPKRAPARALIEEGVPVALGTDCNPGSSPTESLSLVVTLACLELGMLPAEAISAATINAAYAVGRGEDKGSLEPGKAADIVLYDVPSWRAIPYHFGVSRVDRVFVRGRLVFERGRPCYPAPPGSGRA